jgi:DNA-binding MarR family transcriptional regulator
VIHDENCRHPDGAPRRLYNKAFWLLGRAALDAQRFTADRLAQVGMRRGFYGVLATLAEAGPSSQADIGRRLGVDRSDMVAILNDLEGEGYVTREPDPTDRRRNSVAITKSGRTVLARFDRAIGDAEKTFLSTLDAQERKTFVGLLQRITDKS